jgi:hypothetical protein
MSRSRPRNRCEQRGRSPACAVASSLTTVPVRDMIEALIAGERDPAVLALAVLLDSGRVPGRTWPP